MTETVENRMVIDSLWARLERREPPESGENPGGAGYAEIGTGTFISEEDAYGYALERLSSDGELRKEFTEWFYSGNWVKEERE